MDKRLGPVVADRGECMVVLADLGSVSIERDLLDDLSSTLVSAYERRARSCALNYSKISPSARFGRIEMEYACRT